MTRNKTGRRKPQYDALLFQHLEKVSGKLLKECRDIVRDLIGTQSGVYALYKKDKLYYVGLARKLSGRLSTSHGECSMSRISNGGTHGAGTPVLPWASKRCIPVSFEVKSWPVGSGTHSGYFKLPPEPLHLARPEWH